MLVHPHITELPQWAVGEKTFLKQQFEPKSHQLYAIS